MVKKLKSPRRLIALAAFAIVAMSAFGFAAQNNFNGQNRAGNGTDVISGYNISNIHYSLDAGDGDLIDEVRFDLNQPASEAMVSFDGGASWAVCGASVGATNTVTCTGLAVDVFTAANLEVSAVS